MQLTRKRLDGPSLGGLLATRRGALVLAVLCAVTAAGILMFAMSKYRHSVSSSNKQDTALVASTEIQKGTAGDLVASERLYKVTPILASQLSTGAIVNAAYLSGKVAASNILPGQQLTSADFTVGGVGIATELTPSERAISVTPDPAHGLGGVLQTGDHVDVYGSYLDPGLGNIVTLMVPNAVVLKAPAASPAGTTGQTGSVVLGVSEQLTPKVMWVFDYGKVWLELRGVNAAGPNPSVTAGAEVPYPLANATPLSSATKGTKSVTGAKR